MKIERNRGTNNHNIKPISIKSCALFMSEFSHLILIIIIVHIGIIFPSHHKAVTYYSKSSNISWNSTADPLIFTHLSDIHITFFNNLKKYEDLFKAAKNLNASFHLLTGDLVDNYKKRHFPKVGKQNKKDWKIYKYLLDTYLYNETIIDNSGNHDMFGVISPLRKKYGFLDVSKSFNRNNTEFINKFLVKSLTIEGINFILINPYTFPTVHPPYGFYPQTTKKLLDLLEKEINKFDSCYILTHFPVDFFWWEKSSKGHTFGKIMKNKKVHYIFSGHTHPKMYQIKHHEYGGLEFIGTSTKTSNTFGIVTIDNGRLVYNKVKYGPKKETKYYMTHPIPIDQIASPQIFNEKNTEIRIISYDEDINNNLTVSGDFKGKMEYKRTLKNGAKLYSMPLNVTKDGKYKIIVSGQNCFIGRKFYIGEKYKTGNEKKAMSKAFFRLLYVSAILISFFLFIIVLPIKIVNLKFIDDWICGLNNEKCYWIQSICLSPIILNYRINVNTPLYFRIILFFFFIYSLILPIHFFEPIEGYVGFSFMCYIYIKNQIIFEQWSIYFNIFYYWGVISPCAIVVSGFRFKDSWVYIFNFVFLYFAFFCICLINVRWAGESVKTYLLFFHPCYVVIPIILNILIYIALYRYSKSNKSKENYDSTVKNKIKEVGNDTSPVSPCFSHNNLNPKK